MNVKLALAAGFAVLSVLGSLSLRQREGRILDPKFHHLGNDTLQDWKEASAKPEGKRLDIAFESQANTGEWTLFLEQRSIDHAWRVKLNDVEVALLKPFPGLSPRHYSIPAARVKDGANLLSFVPDEPNDDVVIGNVRLVERSLREMFDTQPVSLLVQRASDGAPLPARVTFVDAAGVPVPLYYAESEHTAVREGVIYVSDRAATLELAPGEYTSYATRGCEWSCSVQRVEVKAGVPTRVKHTLARELDTTGFLAADTHIHTLRYSGHGDASVDERQVTLAGEGVELAVATDHNHHTEYAGRQSFLTLAPYYTAVVGNEVTTKVGHFNGFPFDPKGGIPPHDLRDYVAIVAGIRAKGAKVVILNHPRWPSHDESPFTDNQLDRDTGAFATGLELPMDAIEMVNSTTSEADPMFVFGDWFALLNRGVRLFAVGSSDSHTVGDPVGQGRTYFASATDDPTKIDVDAACLAIKNGHTSIGQGMFATVVVNRSARMGDTLEARAADGPLRVELRLQAPSWIVPRKATLYSNGTAIAERAIAPANGKTTDARIEWNVPIEAAFDRWLVCVVIGDAPGHGWSCVNPYTLAATNPVFVDLDGGGWQSPRETAAKILAGAQGRDQALERPMAGADDAIGLHLLDLYAAQLRLAGTEPGQLRRRILDLAGRAAPAHAGVRRFSGRF